MAQTYTFAIPDGTSPEALLDKAKTEGRSKGIAFSGDTTRGQFKGPAEGTYAVDGRTLVITVEKKPGFVPWGMIEKALKGLFGG
jgi:hypothetical protein